MPEVPLTTNAVYSAIPTVMVDGQLNDKVTAQLLSMKMNEHEAGMSDLELHFRCSRMAASSSWARP